jgi:hypothetical protein
MKKYLFLALLVFLLIPMSVSALSYYDLIEGELRYCEDANGKVINIVEGEFLDDMGCPGCFCEFEDGSICRMEDVNQSCRKGLYKNYYTGEELHKLADLKIETGTAGGVISNPGGEKYYFIDKDSDFGRSLQHASANELVELFETEWASKENAKYRFFSLSVCNYSDIASKGSYSLIHNGEAIKTWTTSLNKENLCIDQKLYVALELKDIEETHVFEVVSDQPEMSKKNNVYSFKLSSDNFEYVVHDDQSDYKGAVYIDMDGKQIPYSEIVNNGNDSLTPKTGSLWGAIILLMKQFFSGLSILLN